MQLKPAIQELPCLLICGNREALKENEEELRICQEGCKRWSSVETALESVMHPAVQFDEVARAIYLSKEIPDLPETQREIPCFLVCEKVDGNGFVKGIPPTCYQNCATWQKVRQAVRTIRKEMTFDTFKEYIIKLHLATGTDVSDVMFIRFFTPPEEHKPILPSRLIIPKEEQIVKSPGLYLRLCRLNKWMTNIRYVLGALIALIAFLLQNILYLDFPFSGIYAVAVATILCNLGFKYRLRNHDKEKLELTKRCSICTPNFSQAQIICDFLLLTALIYFTGGIASPASLFYFPHIIFSALLLSKPRRFVNTSLAIALWGGVLLLQYFDFLPSNVLSETMAGFIANPLILLFFWFGFSFYAVLIHYFTLKVTGELGDWQKEIMTLNDLMHARNKMFSVLNNRLTRVDTMRKRMVHVASHDLKSPLAAVEGYLKVMLGGYYGNLNEKQVNALQRSITRLQGMREFINEILDVASLEKEGLRKELGVLDIKPLVKQIEEDSQWLARDKQIKLTFDYPKDLPEIFSSKNRFMQVLQNLVTNAIKFTPESGTVDVKIEAREEDLLFSVRDTGTGISKEDLENVFIEFYRVKNVKLGEVSGSGLGLFIVKSIVNAHGGKIWAESEIGKGSVFYFTMKKASLGAIPTTDLHTKYENTA